MPQTSAHDQVAPAPLDLEYPAVVVAPALVSIVILLSVHAAI